MNKCTHKLTMFMLNTIIFCCRPRDEDDRLQKYCSAVEQPTCPELCKDLDYDEVVSNPVELKKPASFPKWTAGKDPCNCPTLIFHDEEYIRNASLLLWDPVVVMPIVEQVPAGNVKRFRWWSGGSHQHTKCKQGCEENSENNAEKYMTTQYEYTATFHPEIQTNAAPVTEEQQNNCGRWLQHGDRSTKVRIVLFQIVFRLECIKYSYALHVTVGKGECVKRLINVKRICIKLMNDA